MAPLRFSANVSWLFPELPGLPARLRAAGSSGFEAAEVGWPYGEPPEALARAAQEVGLQLVLINTPPGDREKGEMGLGAVPGRQAAFRDGLEQAVLYAKALGCPSLTWKIDSTENKRSDPSEDRSVQGGCGSRHEEKGHGKEFGSTGGAERPGEMGSRHDRRAAGRGAPRGRGSEDSRFEDGLHSPLQAHFPHRIHLMAGRVPQGADRAAVRGEMETVFLENLRHAAGVLAQENLVGLLEPINTRITDPRYFLDTPQQAAAILEKVGRPNLQLQMDIFHWQIMDGNLTGNIREFLPFVDEGYKGFVGCEYQPRGDTVEGLSWLRSYWDKRGCPQAGQ
ncbi:putative hydroxypyruvate isomerase isoform X2 [Physeter macrocephalus]|uniref:Hydroxypyruvate isomerase isoform X2 n=1 Tax=Physeter macrocephalus TaxID=9755 RepID=A0A9W2WHC0_PHYMC|nr:putative hydroxypyruvate isomerase isoform X2 [Physeter catodon]